MTDEEVGKALWQHVEDYKRRHPIRQAVFHDQGKCLCLRCFVDLAESACHRLKTDLPE